MALLENAGGSQVPREVAQAIGAYMLDSYVQLGAGYAMSDRATRTVAAAHEVVETVLGAGGAGRAILGASTTQLLTMLSSCLAQRVQPGDEVVIAESGHEASIGPFLRLARQGAVVRWWKVDRDAQDCPLAGLDAVLSPRTRLVVTPHVSNLLGAIVPVDEVVRRAHAVGARVLVDGVALAPHRIMDVERWGVDWYAYSAYKVYGPHMGVLYGRHEALAELDPPNHFFIPRDQVPYAFELGGSSHEGCAALVALATYLAFLAGDELDARASLDRPAAGLTRETVQRAFARITELELPLQRAMVEGVRRHPRLRLVGPADYGAWQRVPTLSVVREGEAPADTVRRAHAAGVAIRSGHMYAYRLCQALGIPPESGVVRLSAVHYNTVDEVERAVEAVAGVGAAPRVHVSGRAEIATASPVARWRVLRAGGFWLDGGGMFGLIPRTMWSAWAAPDALNRIPLAMNAVLLELPGELGAGAAGGAGVSVDVSAGASTGAQPTRVLVETGAGGKWSAKERAMYDFAAQPDGSVRTIEHALAEVGVTPESIAHVVVTHLHFDHAGGLTRQRGDALECVFANAAVHVQRREWDDALANRSTMTRTYLRSHLDPIADRVVLHDGESEVVPGVRVRPIAGHTWGQQGVVWTDTQGTLCYPADLLPTVHHSHPAASLGYDMEPYETMLTKRALLAEAEREGWRLVLDHEPGPCVVRVAGGRLLPESPAPA